MDLHQKAAATSGGDAPDHGGLRAVFVNASLKRDWNDSRTALLLGRVAAPMERAGVAVDRIHMRDHWIAYGVEPDMAAHERVRDDWPGVWTRIRDADILIVGTPSRLGGASSLCHQLIERLHGMSGLSNDRGQPVFHGKVGGVVVTGHEDGATHAAATVGHALSCLGFTIPPRFGPGRIGEEAAGSIDGDAAVLARDAMHLARVLRGGFPDHGNDRRAGQGEGRDPSPPDPGHRP
ncbi:flavodoxin family protein [Jannaschia sp. LMIT008]|uniref:flavodoxin family protein n=1 Tax=Jannaschia maritima TaxID=3032585 RepID=UPI00281246A8|nr:NAD(P)H-dependent oxidoreductase [Jannaschia sp. LMIT008]